MGSLRKFDLGGLARRFDAPYFCETGTWKGDGVAWAARTPFRKLFSIEIFEAFAVAARERFRADSRIEIVHADSLTGLAQVASRLDGNCVFWLDAHFPAADEGIRSFNAEAEESIRLPLEQELELLARRLPRFQDVILIDDLRIYEVGPYRSGNMPADIVPPKVRNVAFATRLFGTTHDVVRSFQDEGYLCLVPKGKAAPGWFARLRCSVGQRLQRRVL